LTCDGLPATCDGHFSTCDDYNPTCDASNSTCDGENRPATTKIRVATAIFHLRRLPTTCDAKNLVLLGKMPVCDGFLAFAGGQKATVKAD
jgi:hypothetical protein